MSEADRNLSRRELLRAATAAGAVAALGGAGVARAAGVVNSAPASAPATGPAKMPLRTFGRSGVKVPILALGGIFDIANNQVMLHQALRLGVTYWDTANSYANGNSELGIGAFFAKNPLLRKDVFLVSKSGKKDDPDGLSEHLATSLERMQTDTIDMLFIHGVGSASQFRQNQAMWKDWAAKQKEAGKIRLFGFSTHRRMEECLIEAAKADFIDGIMLKYDFRLMDQPRMKEAVQACAKAGIGLTAMKTQAKKSTEAADPREQAIMEQFVAKGLTFEQACLKAVWANPDIASICSQMHTLPLLQANYAAASDGMELSAADRALLEQYAAGCGGYCAACGACEELAGGLPIPDVMRCLMYAGAYGNLRLARQEFLNLPAAVREKLAKADYSLAQSRCPQGLAISELMAQANSELA